MQNHPDLQTADLKDGCPRYLRSATASLILGLLSCATIPMGIVLFTLGAVFGSGFTVPLVIALVAAGILMGVLAIVTGYLSNRSIKHSEGKLTGEKRATPGMVWGSIGLGIWSLPIILLVFLLAFPSFFRPRGNIGSVGVASLRVINEAAAAYSCSYDRGYPPSLAALGPPKVGRFQTTPAPSPEAAGFISEALASGLISGIRVTYTAGPVDSAGKIPTYATHADPIEWHQYTSYYFSDQTGVLRVDIKEANANSGPLSGGYDTSGWKPGDVNCSNADNFRGLARPFPGPPK